jgi:hypothetical protein
MLPERCRRRVKGGMMEDMKIRQIADLSGRGCRCCCLSCCWPSTGSWVPSRSEYPGSIPVLRVVFPLARLCGVTKTVKLLIGGALLYRENTSLDAILSSSLIHYTLTPASRRTKMYIYFVTPWSQTPSASITQAGLHESLLCCVAVIYGHVMEQGSRLKTTTADGRCG